MADDAVSLRPLGRNAVNKQMTKVAMVAVVGAGLDATDTLMPVEHSAKFD
jgi:hypothetical protein